MALTMLCTTLSMQLMPCTIPSTPAMASTMACIRGYTIRFTMGTTGSPCSILLSARLFLSHPFSQLYRLTYQ